MLQTLLDEDDGGYEGAMNAEKYRKMTSTPKPTATRDLADLVANGQMWTTGIRKPIHYYVAVPRWTHGVVPDVDVASASDDDDGTTSVDQPSMR